MSTPFLMWQERGLLGISFEESLASLRWLCSPSSLLVFTSN